MNAVHKRASKAVRRQSNRSEGALAENGGALN